MREGQEIVIDTGPLIALVAALGSLSILKLLYARVIVPLEVAGEISASDSTRFAAAEFNAATWIERRMEPSPIGAALRTFLGAGEASVIQCALSEEIATVVIDEAVGRRQARLHGLHVIGSLGILIRAKREGLPIALRQSIESMRGQGIWLSDRLVADVLEQAGNSARSHRELDYDMAQVTREELSHDQA